MRRSPLESQIYEQLNLDDSFNPHNDQEYVGPWHKYNSSVHKKLQQQVQRQVQGQSPQSKLIKREISNTKQTRPGRRLSQDCEKAFVEKPKYDQNRQVERIITEYFKDTDIRSKKKKNSNVGFFLSQDHHKHQHSKSNISQFQTSSQYFDKMAIKMIKSMPKLKKPTLRIPKQIQHGYCQPMLEQLTTRNKRSLISYATPLGVNCSTSNNKNNNINNNNVHNVRTESSKINQQFFTKTGKVPLWKLQNS